MTVSELDIRSVDGLSMGATLSVPDGASRAALLVHGGGGVDRHEWRGLYDRLARRLNQAGIATMAFDHRSYLSAHDRSIDLTITGVANDIAVAFDAFIDATGIEHPHVLAGSFGGGAAALWASHNPGRARSLVLMYPLLDYRRRLLATKPWWKGGSIDDQAAGRLTGERPLRHTPRMSMGRALINEAAFFDAESLLRNCQEPTLVIHGTSDPITVHEVSEALEKAGVIDELYSIDGADHGFSTPGDIEHADPESRRLQAMAFDRAADWINGLD